MNLYQYIRSLHTRSFIRVFFLAFTFLFGLYFGARTAVTFADTSFLLMSPGLLDRASIVGLLTVAAVPFVLTVISVYCLHSYVLIILSFLRAFLFGYAVQMVSLSFGAGGWAVAVLTMFSAYFLLPLDCWLWIRRLFGHRKHAAFDFLVYTICAICIVAVDYCYVSVLSERISMF